MKNITLKENYKEYTINNDENRVIRFDPNDANILNRIDSALDEMEKLFKKYKEDTPPKISNERESIREAAKIIKEYDLKMREQINYIFDSDVCSVVFGNQNCLSLCGGYPQYINFLNAIIPEMKKEIAAEQKKSQENIKKYTSDLK